MLVDVCIQKKAAWLVGESEADAWARRRAVDDNTSAADYHPGYHKGRVAWVQDAELPHDPVDDALFSVVRLDLPQEAVSQLRSGDYKLPPGSDVPLPVTFTDRYGAIAVDLQRRYPGATVTTHEEELTAIITTVRQNRLSELAYVDEVRAWKEQYAASVVAGVPFVEPQPKPPVPLAVPEPIFTRLVAALRRRLPKTEVHSGTGYYAVKATPTKNDDTQSGLPAGQVVTLTTGGLGTTGAFLGGYVWNATRAEVRAIVSHTDTTITLEGDLSAWLNGDDLDVYDAWSTIQGALDQLYVDQGTTAFTSNQYVRIFAGTYSEAINPNVNLNPDDTNGRTLIIEGDPEDSRENIIVQGSGATSQIVSINMDHVVVRHFRVNHTGATSNAVRVTTGATSPVVFEDLHVVNTGLNVDVVTLYDVATFLDCNFECPGISTRDVISAISPFEVRRCRFKFTGNYGITCAANPATVLIETCGFRGLSAGSIGVYSAPSTGLVKISNCTFYECGYAIQIAAGASMGRQTHVTNCIFQGQLSHCLWMYTNPEESATVYGPAWFLRNNYYYDYAKFAYTGVDRTFAEFNAFNMVDQKGQTDGVDPKLTDPDNDDFRLQDGSPCIRGGGSTPATHDLFGTVLDRCHPDVGAVAYRPPIFTTNLHGRWLDRSTSLLRIGKDHGPDDYDMENIGGVALDPRVGGVFDGTNRLRRLEANWRVGDSVGTIMAWVKLSTTGIAHAIFGSSDEATTNRFLALYVTPEDYLAIQSDDGSHDAVRGTTPLVVDRWYHVAGQSNGSVWTLYVNGKVETLVVQNGTNGGDWFADISDRDNVTLGMVCRKNLLWPFEGTIRDSRCYSSVLTANEIASIVAKGVPDITPWSRIGANALR